MNPDDNQLKKNVLLAIQSGELKQRSRRYFALRGALIGVGIGLIGCLILYLASFIFFVLRQTGVWFVPAFGFRGWFSFLVNAPWLLIGLAAVFIIVLEVLVRRYAFAYREPLAYSAMGIIIIAFAGGFLVFETSVHRVLFQSAEDHGLPAPFAVFYRSYGEQHFDDIHTGMVLATTSAGFIIQEMDETATASVEVASDTNLPALSGAVPSATVVVFGSESGSVIHAVGVHVAGSDVLWVAPQTAMPAPMPQPQPMMPGPQQ